MEYKFVFTKKAASDLEQIEHQEVKRIIKKIAWFEAQSNPLTYGKRLHEPAAGDIRFRIGDYRVVAIINEKQHRIEVVQIGHRREIYR